MGILSQGRSSVSQGREDRLCMLDLPSGDSPTAGVDLVFQDLPLSSRTYNASLEDMHFFV